MKKTLFHDEHVARGGRMVEFAGYSLPVLYTSILEEHAAVRTKAGLFDVSHMGEFFAEGPRALDFVQYLITNDAGAIPDGGVVYLEADDGTTVSSPAPPAEVKRIHYYFPDRTSKAYADFDRKTWTARLGMGGERSADAVVGVRASNLPNVLGVSLSVGDKLQSNGLDSLLAVQVDYEASSAYRKSVLFRNGIGNAGKPLPWGTKARPNQTVRLGDALDLAKYAPKGWGGRAIITFRMHNTGPDTRAKIRLQTADR